MKTVTSILIFSILSYVSLAQQTAQVKNANEDSLRKKEIDRAVHLRAIDQAIERMVKEAHAVKRDPKSLADNMLGFQKMAFECTIKEEEMRTASEKYVKAHPVVFDSDKDLTRRCRALVAALGNLKGQKENVEKVFLDMNLEKYGITRKDWENYVSINISQAQRIVSQNRVPKNQEELDSMRARSQSSLRYHYEAGLVATRILLEYNEKNPNDRITDEEWKDQGEQASKKKKAAIMKWWMEKLTNYFSDKAEREELCTILTTKSMQGLNKLVGKTIDWRPYFKDKLKK